MKTILSWNVNGLRAIGKKGFAEWILEERPGIMCVQETRAREEQLPENLRHIDGYHSYFVSAERKGYSGVALYSREKPLAVHPGFGRLEFDREGRTIIAEYRDFTLFNIYFPNGGSSRERLIYKLDFYAALLQYLDSYTAENHRVIICGDVNTAHTELDLARPRENEGNSGFLPVERAWIDSLIEHGFTDTFRMFDGGGGRYTWWDYKTRSRERNTGWRIDYVFVTRTLEPIVDKAFILSDVTGSDHCPVGIVIDN